MAYNMSVTGTTPPAAVGGDVTGWQHADGGAGELFSAAQAYYDRKLLERSRPKLIAQDFGQKRPLPSNNSLTIKFRKYNDLSRAISSLQLAEGTVGDGEKMSITDILAAVRQYGNFVTISDLVQVSIEDPVLNEAVDLLAEQMADTIDTITFSALNAGTNVRLAASGADIANLASAITGPDFDYAIRMFRRNNADPFTEIVRASTGFNTFPIRPAYWAFVHPDVAKDLENISGFISVERYASQGPVHEAEIGAYKNIRFLMTTQCPVLDHAGNPAHNPGSVATWVPCTTNTTKANVYSTILVAKNAYGLVDLDKGTVRSIVKTPGASDTSNPLNQFSTAGWKLLYTAKILDESKIIRIQSLATL